MSDAYAAAGVDTHQADQGVAAIVSVLKSIETGRESLSVPLPGHYASVMRLPGPLAPNVGIALATDSVGSKVIVAEQTGRFDTIGIDCVAMNVNDLICVGATPLALLDYIAVERAEPELLEAIGRGLAVGASAAGVEIPGGEVCQVPEVLRGHPSPFGFDLVGSAFGVVELDKIIDGSRVRPGDVMIGLPASGIHSNGMTLARRALLDDGGLTMEQRPELLRGQSVADVLLEPTVIYVRAVLALIGSAVEVRGLAHITGGGLMNLRRIGSGVGYSISRPLPSPPVFELIAALGEIAAAEMWEVFNMGCGFVAMVPAEHADAAVELLSEFHPGAAVIGELTAEADAIDLPHMRIRAPAGSDRLAQY
jgi:phosphoribosylformylglycinamidine cyclo-ligase